MTSPPSPPPPSSGSRRGASIAFGLGTLCLVWGAGGPVLTSVALVLAAWVGFFLTGTTRRVAVVVSLGPVFMACEGLWALGAVCCVALAIALGGRDRTAVWGAIAVVGLGLIEAARQLAIRPALHQALDGVPALLLAALLLALLWQAVPGPRATAVSLGLGALLLAGLGVSLALQAPHGDLRLLAPRVDRAGAWVLWPALERRGLEELRGPSDGAGALAVLAHTSGGAELASEVVRVLGPESLLATGWPVGPGLSAEAAVPVAWALVSRGRQGRALRLLRQYPRQGELAFHLAAMAHAAGDEELAAHAWARATVPATATTGVWIDGVDLLNSDLYEVFAVVEAPASGLVVEATGTEFEGPARLALSLDGRSWGPVDVRGRQRFNIEQHLAPGPHRLLIHLKNDAKGPGGDRNLLDLRVWVAASDRHP